MVRGALVVSLLAGLLSCGTPLLDAPDKVRHHRVPGAPFTSPLFHYKTSDDGTSVSWSAALAIVGRDIEEQRRTSWLFPLWYREQDPPYSETNLLVPLYYGRTSAHERWRFFTPLYGWIASDTARTDYVLGPIFKWQRSYAADAWNSALFLLYDWDHRDARNDMTLLPLLGLAHLARIEWGYPAEGETVPALGRSASRRFELLNLLGIISLFGYDDVGDRREFRVATLFSSEMLSPIRSWRGRGDDPFVREWVFPLYMNVADEDGGWSYVGPLWGSFHDTAAETTTDWWLAGLLARNKAPNGTTWRLLGIPIVGP